MPHDGQDLSAQAAGDTTPILPDLLALTGAAIGPCETVLETACDRVRGMVAEGGKVSGALIEAHQTAAHGLAWLATYVEALRQMQGWAERLQADGTFGETEALLHQIAFGEYLWQIYGGIPMSQGEIVRLQDLGLSQDDQRALMAPEVQQAMLGRPGEWVALAVYEWSGRWQQKLVLDWVAIRDAESLAAAAAQVAAARRSFAEFPTAVGYALGFGAGLLARAPDCERRTLDLSGDGINNEGFGPRLAYANFPFGGVTVNGLVIEDRDLRVRDFYVSEVIRGRGAFVEQARGYENFEAAMRRKLVREIGVLVVGGDTDGGG